MGDSGASNERARRKAATRARLSAAALELFASQGYDSTTVAQIAAAAHVSARTFFVHFATKADALFDFGPDDYHDLIRCVVEVQDAETDYDVLCRATIECLERRGTATARHHQAKLLALSTASSPVLRGKHLDENDLFIEMCSRALAVRHGRPAPIPDDEIVAVIVGRLIHATYAEWASSPSTTDFRRLAFAKFDRARSAMAVPRKKDANPANRRRIKVAAG